MPIQYDPKEVVDLPYIARLLGVSEHTPNQWRQRTAKGELDPPFPEPDFPHLAHPLWFRQTIVDWAKRSHPPRWPRGAAARPRPAEGAYERQAA